MVCPFGDNLANRRLQPVCITFLVNMFRDLMEPQWRVRRRQGDNLRIEGESQPSTISSQQDLNSQEVLVPLAFNWGAQYMVETPAPIESQIVKKEISLLREYESHQGSPLVSNPFWEVRIFLARDLQAKAHLAYGIR